MPSNVIDSVIQPSLGMRHGLTSDTVRHSQTLWPDHGNSCRDKHQDPRVSFVEWAKLLVGGGMVEIRISDHSQTDNPLRDS